MPSFEYIKEKTIEDDINSADAKVYIQPTECIRVFKNALTAHYEKAISTGEYKKELEEMLKKYQTYILQDQIILDAVVKSSKIKGEYFD